MTPTPSARVLAFLLTALFSALPAAAHADDAASAGRVAVIVVATTDADADTAGELSDVLVATLSSRPATEPVGRDEFLAALRDAAGSADEALVRRCVDDLLCLAKVGAALGARRVLAGRLGHAGTLWRLTLRLVEPSTGRALREGVRDGASPAAIAGAVPALVDELLALDLRARLLVEPTSPGALVLVDGKPAGSSAHVELYVDPGRHEVVVTKAGMETFVVRVEVAAGETRTVSAPLRPPSEAHWYTRWWLWTGVAVVAGGAATAAYLLTRHDPLRDADFYYRIGDPR
jgi:hypothetical protein